MASHPPGKCCFERVIAEGTPRGEMTKIEESMFLEPSGDIDNNIFRKEKDN